MVSPLGLHAPDGSTYITLTDGAGNIIAPGTVTSVSVTTANGISGSVATATTTPAITLSLGNITPTSIIGVTDASSAAAGSVGEILTSTIALDSVSMTSNAAGNIGSISLTAGDWDIWGSVYYLSATASISYLEGSLSLTTNVRDLTPGNFASLATPAAVVGGNRTSLTIPARQITVSSTTSVFLVGFTQFTLATLSAGGKIYARRRR